MKSTELAKAVHDIVQEAQGRILESGAEQYTEDDGTQRFETLPMKELVTYLEEELMDQINYSVMMILRLRQICGTIEKVVDGIGTEEDDCGAS